MKKWSKLVALAMAAALMFAFAACNNGDKNGTTKAPSGSQATATAFKAIPKDKIKVGVIHIGDPDSGSGYSYAHDQGIKGMQKNVGLADNQIVRKNFVADEKEPDIEKAIRECIEQDGCNVIFGTSYGYMAKMENLASEYPEIIFSHCSGYKNNGKNLNNYFGRIYEARYLTGIAAGLKTKTNKIGYVAAQGSKNPEVTGGIDAFALGVKSVNPDAKVYVKVTNTWFDVQKEKDAAVALLDQGCDIIAQHQDTAQPQLAAQDKGVWGIGYNSDMSKEAPKATITSTVWDWSIYYTKAVQQIIAGEWKCENYFEGMKEGLVGFSPLSASLAAEGTQAKIDAAKAKIISGDLKVFAGEIKDNKGTVRVKSGDVLDDGYIAGQIDWYVDNVVG